MFGTSSTRGRVEIRVQDYSQTRRGERISGICVCFGV